MLSLVFVTIVTGAPGAGKSITASALQSRLADDGRANALIEIDEMSRCYPALDRRRALRHVHDLAASYADAGHDLLLVTDTCETDEWYDGLTEALPAGDRLLVLLQAEPTTLSQRVAAREPPTWSGYADLVAWAAKLGEQMQRLSRVDVRVDTERLATPEVVEQIHTALRERGVI
jgi:broad-specificity NMP kinase